MIAFRNNQKYIEANLKIYYGLIIKKNEFLENNNSTLKRPNQGLRRLRLHHEQRPTYLRHPLQHLIWIKPKHLK